MDEILRRALGTVLRDLAASGVTLPCIEDQDWTGDPSRPSALLWSADGSGVGIAVTSADPLADRVASVGDQIKDWAIDELQGSQRTNWPPCPRHPDTHPLGAAVHDNQAIWRCPADGVLIAVMGEWMR